MGQNTLDCREMQAQRLKIKQIGQQLQNLAVSGAGISPWEAKELVTIVEEIYFNDAAIKVLSPGQIRHCCVKLSEPPGKPIKDCQMETVVLSLFDDEDNNNLSWTGKEASLELRRRRMMRICSEAYEQGGLLSQEDLALILMCDVRTIRRDIATLKEMGITVPTRGTIKDIGPGVTHREIAIRLWIEGKEPTEISKRIQHSIKSTENYIEKFKRVVYLCRKGFSHFEISRTIGISVSATKVFIELHNSLKNTGLFATRVEEIELVGKAHYNSEDEKKDSTMLKISTNNKRGVK